MEKKTFLEGIFEMPTKWGKRRWKSLNEIQPAYSFTTS